MFFRKKLIITDILIIEKEQYDWNKAENYLYTKPRTVRTANNDNNTIVASSLTK